jgi:hypothetical protein
MDLDAEIVLQHEWNHSAAGQPAEKDHRIAVVTGSVLYYLDGMLSTHSHVEEIIKIFIVSENNTEKIGYAKAVESEAPQSSKNFILFVRQGQAATPADELLRRNAVKFAKMIHSMFSAPDGSSESNLESPGDDGLLNEPAMKQSTGL